MVCNETLLLLWSLHRWEPFSDPWIWPWKLSLPILGPRLSWKMFSRIHSPPQPSFRCRRARPNQNDLQLGCVSGVLGSLHVGELAESQALCQKRLSTELTCWSPLLLRAMILKVGLLAHPTSPGLLLRSYILRLCHRNVGIGLGKSISLVYA